MDFKVRDAVNAAEYRDILEIASAAIDWSRFENRTVFITGAGGFIGGYLVKALLERNDSYQNNITVTGLVRNREKAEKKLGALAQRHDLRLIVQDVTSPIENVTADFIIHAASQASNIQFENDPVGTISANLAGASNVLELAKKSKAQAVLIISSLKVYGEIFGDREKMTESDSGYIDFTNYKNCYAMGKRASETLAASYAREYGLNVKIARPAYIYGAAGLDDDRVWAQFIANAVRRENILLKSSGAAKRSFCYVTDTASALLKILLDGENALPYNISNESSDVTIRDFAKAVCRAFPERNISLSFKNPGDSAEPETSPSPLSKIPEVLDNTRLKALGWTAKVSLDEGIKRAAATTEESL